MDKTKPPVNGGRLCDICANGAVLRGHSRLDFAQLQEEVICLFLGRVIEIDVTECNRFVERAPQANAEGARADTAWVA
jgi:hypothetical protein